MPAYIKYAVLHYKHGNHYSYRLNIAFQDLIPDIVHISRCCDSIPSVLKMLLAIVSNLRITLSKGIDSGDYLSSPVYTRGMR